MYALVRNKTVQVGAVKWVCGLLIIFIIVIGAGGGNTFAGEPGDEVLHASSMGVDVQLAGVSEYGVVQLFAYLLAKSEIVTDVQPVSMRLKADDPQQCRVQWQVIIKEDDPGKLVEQLTQIINDLDPKQQNTILYESPFIVTNGDMEQLKKVNLLHLVDDRVLFALEGYQEVSTDQEDAGQAVNRNPWLKIPGAGFE